MHSLKYVTLKRDCPATLIPTAVSISIPAGTKVEITQSLGSTVTVYAGGNLARVEAKDLDALGFECEEKTTSHLDQLAQTDLQSAVWQCLEQCYDPEIPVNIVALGLIYNCRLEKQQVGYYVTIEMTLTAPGCGMGPILVNDVKQALLALEPIHHVEVELVFDPPWSRDKMSEEAQLTLGLL